MALQGPAFICYLFISSSGGKQHETRELKGTVQRKESLPASSNRVVIFSKFVLQQKSLVVRSMPRLPSANAAFVTDRRHQEKFVHILWFFRGSRLSREILGSCYLAVNVPDHRACPPPSDLHTLHE